MRNKIIFIFVLIVCFNNNVVTQNIKQSYFKLTTSNGLITAVYNSKKETVEYVFPHIFENYDSSLFVKPFIGNIKLNTDQHPLTTEYTENTHVICAEYKRFSVYYFASFVNCNKIFYIAIKGDKEIINNISLEYESGKGKLLSGINLLTNSHSDLSVRTSGSLLSGNVLCDNGNKNFVKYFMFSLVDSFHNDRKIIINEIERLRNSKNSLIDEEINYLKNIFSKALIPNNISANVKNVIEQSIAFLKMSQVAQNEVFPLSRGQILASLRPGLWHVSWVRDGSYAIQALSHLGLYDEAKRGLEFMLNADAGYFKHYIYNGKDYGVGNDYKISVCRYFGNGKEESTYVNGPNIEFDNFGLFLIAFCDYVKESDDSIFYKKYNDLVTEKIADVIVNLIDINSLIREDSGPWEHYLQFTKQYTFTSGVCALGLKEFAKLQLKYNLNSRKYSDAYLKLKSGIMRNMLCENTYIKGNLSDVGKNDHEYYDAGVYEIFANGLIDDKELFLSHMNEYDKYLRISGSRPGYIRLNSYDPYENQEWVFIDLRIALADLNFGKKEESGNILNYITEQANANNNTIPEMISNKIQLEKMKDEFREIDVWCNCVRDNGEEYIGAIPMIGYGAGVYILSTLAYYAN